MIPFDILTKEEQTVNYKIFHLNQNHESHLVSNYIGINIEKHLFLKIKQFADE